MAVRPTRSAGIGLGVIDQINLRACSNEERLQIAKPTGPPGASDAVPTNLARPDLPSFPTVDSLASKAVDFIDIRSPPIRQLRAIARIYPADCALFWRGRTIHSSREIRQIRKERSKRKLLLIPTAMSWTLT